MVFTFLGILEGESVDINGYDDIEDARRLATWKLGGAIAHTAEEIRDEWERYFPNDVDVVEHVGQIARIPEFNYNIFDAQQIVGYDVVASTNGQYSNRLTGKFQIPPRILLIRIPESGVVRCPAQFMARVIGKGGNRIKELSQLHECTIRLVKI